MTTSGPQVDGGGGGGGSDDGGLLDSINTSIKGLFGDPSSDDTNAEDVTGSSGGHGPIDRTGTRDSGSESPAFEELAPEWVLDLEVLGTFADRVRRHGLTGAIVGIVATFIVGVFIDVWTGVLSSVQFVAATIAALPQITFFGPLTDAVAPIGATLDRMWVDYAAWALETSQGFGPAAPFAALMLFTPPIAATGFVFQLSLGLLDTWLPISELPVIGWLL